MPSSKKNRLLFLRAVVAALVAIALWGVASLSDTYVTTLNVPLTLVLSPDHALIQEAPRSFEVTIQAQGWSLLKIFATGRTEIVIRPDMRGAAAEKVVRLTSRDLLNNLRTSITDVQQIRVSPDTLTLVIGHVARKRVPLFPEVTINTRDGFQVIGPLRLTPDSVTLTGAANILQEISVWPTESAVMNDVHRSIRMQIPVSDTLRGVVTPYHQSAELRADVQEIAERSFTAIPLVNGTIRDTNLSLVLEPKSVDVVVRGGVRDLGKLNPANISAYVNVQEGIDTTGIVRPRLILPPGVSVVSITPDKLRYAYRRVLSVEF